MRLFFISVFTMVAFFSFGQESQYRNVDSLMRQYNVKIRTADDLYKVVYYIRQTFSVDSLRLRASLIWITENIAYDVKAYLADDPSAGNINYAVKNKKAVCSGYSSLLKYFCSAFDIECEIVTGFARTGKKTIVLNQNYLRSNHSWNAVKINGSWRLIDPTWAAGFVDDRDEDNLGFYKKFNEIYYFTLPEKLILNHYPDQKQFKLTNKRVDQLSFRKSPLFTSSFLANNILAASPDTSLIRVRLGDTITFKLKTENKIYSLFAFSENFEKARYEAKPTYKDGWIEFNYPVRLLGFYNLYIGYYLNPEDENVLLGYKLEVK